MITTRQLWTLFTKREVKKRKPIKMSLFTPLTVLKDRGNSDPDYDSIQNNMGDSTHHGLWLYALSMSHSICRGWCCGVIPRMKGTKSNTWFIACLFSGLDNEIYLRNICRRSAMILYVYVEWGSAEEEEIMSYFREMNSGFICVPKGKNIFNWEHCLSRKLDF